jgi:hypothetical protein
VCEIALPAASLTKPFTMTFFTPVQLRVLKTSGLVLLLFAAGQAAVSYFTPLLPTGISPASLTMALNVLVTATWMSWEFIIKREWLSWLIMFSVTAIAFEGQYQLYQWLTAKGDAALIVPQFNLFAAYLIAIITRFHLTGNEKKLQAALLVTLVFFFLPKTGNPFSMNFLWTGMQQKLSMLWLTPGLLLFCKIICYYVITFLMENVFRMRRFMDKLPSKVQVYSRWEYLFIWFTVFFTYLGCIGTLTSRVAMLFNHEEMQSEPAWLGILTMLFTVFFLYTGALLLRNVITGRLLTTGRYSPWLLLVHLVPVVNIVAVAICFFAFRKRETHMKNAADYIQTPREHAQRAMIILGILTIVYNLYHLLVTPTGARLPVIGILIFIYLLKAVAYVRLPAGKVFVYVVTGLNVLTVATALDDHLILYLALIYLYHYFLMELFYPELEPEDIMEVAQADEENDRIAI